MPEPFALICYEDGSEEALWQYPDTATPHLASVLLEEGIFEHEEALTKALERAFEVCLSIQLPIRRHFRPLHIIGREGHLSDDWALSDLGWFLLLLNGQALNTHVARAQAYAINVMMRR